MERPYVLQAARRPRLGLGLGEGLSLVLGPGPGPGPGPHRILPRRSEAAQHGVADREVFFAVTWVFVLRNKLAALKAPTHSWNQSFSVTKNEFCESKNLSLGPFLFAKIFPARFLLPKMNFRAVLRNIAEPEVQPCGPITR